MCGIVGYIGAQQAEQIIISGLEKLEYRGYDSAGICTVDRNSLNIRRSNGKLVNLQGLLKAVPVRGSIGIGHTRWATHGKPSEANAHPHKAGPVAVVHNGIIENHLVLKERLRSLGHTFRSETDTEVIAHLIEQHMLSGIGFEDAVRLALTELKGAYAICVLCEYEPETLIAAKHGSPMVVGLGHEEFFVASDIPAILAHTREMVFMEDGEMVVFRDSSHSFSSIVGDQLEKESRHVDWTPMMAEKGGYRHFMLKEIFEQPRAIQDTLAGRLLPEQGDVVINELLISDEILKSIQRIVIIGCGTSWHAGLVGKYLLEERCRLPVEVDIASEFRYRSPLVDPETLLLVISQSGETADSLAALREARKQGARTLAICNVVDSSIARASHGVLYTHAGPEIGVASTKAFTTQLVALNLLSIRLGRLLGTIDPDRGRAMIKSLMHLPVVMNVALKLNTELEKLAHRYQHSNDFLYLGRGINYPIALEGALKLKEISYIHAEGYPAGEMKHGPIALIDENMPVVVLVPQDRHYEKVVSNMEEVISRGGRVIAISSSGDYDIGRRAEACIALPHVSEDLLPVLYAVPMQLLAYHISTIKGMDVDQPRNLAKSVTVE